MNTYTERQQEIIEDFRDNYKIDITKGFYWQFESEDTTSDDQVVDWPGAVGIIIYPKEHWDKHKRGFDQHGSAEDFLSEEDQSKLGEACESVYEYEGTEDEFKVMIAKYSPFFEHKKMF
jgi:hypothetical protein